VIITNFAADTIWQHRQQTDRRDGQAAILRRTLDIVRRGVRKTKETSGSVLGLGLGVPGLVDVTTGRLLFAPNLQWRDVPLRTLLEAEFSFPIYVDNEANLAALGESYFGAARGSRNVLYVSAGVGLGGGIIIDGRIVPGAAGFTGEVGHMTIEPNGLQCNCGNRGCWETLVSQGAVFRRVREAVAGGGRSRLAEHPLNLDRLTIPMIAQAAGEGDGVALQALEETGVYLGIGLANLINALNPEIVVFGGILSMASDYLLPVIRRVVCERALHWSVESMRVMVASHGSESCAMGGVASVYHQILSQPFKSARADGYRREAAPRTRELKHNALAATD
jgi:glucokinase-like ROK family protein